MSSAFTSALITAGILLIGGMTHSTDGQATGAQSVVHALHDHLDDDGWGRTSPVAADGEEVATTTLTTDHGIADA